MYLTLKRVCDLVFAICLLLILSPLMILAALAVKLTSRGPVLFRQWRLGLAGKPFVIYKFRSMVVGAEEQGSGVYSFADDVRVTPIGRFLRKTSIDELPQLFNILRGEMSFIGPRPPLTYHPWPLGEYSPEQLRRFTVRPGITGWAQVNGRKGLAWEDRLRFDIEYVERMNPTFDLKIFLMTLRKVFSMHGNYNVSNTVSPGKNKPSGT